MAFKRNQRKKPAKQGDTEKVEDPTPPEVLNIETENVKGKICNVLDHEMTWKIPNFRCDKSYSVTFLLPRGIQW